MAQRQFRSDDTSQWTEKYGNGSHGTSSINTSTDGAPNTTLTGTISTTSATVASGSGFSNGDLVLIHQTQGTGVGSWELNKLSSGGGTTSWTMAYSLTNTYGTGAQVYGLTQASTVSINSGQTLSGHIWNGSTGGILALLASQSITVTGNIDVTGRGLRGGAVQTSSATGFQGESSTGTGGQSTAANAEGGGAGSGGVFFGGGGGAGGGHSAPGAAGAGAGSSGIGGTAGTVSSDTADLTNARFGGAGGSGGIWNGSGPSGVGGASGGFIILIAPSITITGLIVNNAGNGGNAIASGDVGGGGAGSGGAILFKGQNITLGTTLVTAIGGFGGNPNGSGGVGGTGAVGRIHADYLTSLSGTTNPTIDSRQDSGLAFPGGGFFAMLV